MADPKKPTAKGKPTGARAARPSAKPGTKASAKPRGKPAGKAKPTRKQIGKRIAAGLAITVLVAMIAGFAVVGIAYSRTTVPDPNSDFQTNTTFLYYRDGKSQLGSLAVQNRQSISYQEMPQNIKDAVVAAENRTFWTDPGISVPGMIRAAWAIARGGDVQGGSTITQQYIKIYYLNSDRSFTRKFKELLLAVKLSRDVPKEKILEGYLNTIYFGRGAYGIQAAAKSYFDTDAAKLTDAQSAVLASVLNNPGLFDPSAAKGNKERLLERYRYVVDGMAEMGALTPTQQDKDRKALPKFPDIPISQRYGGTNGYLMAMIEEELPRVTGLSPAEVAGGGLKVTTTFDPDMQKSAVRAAESNTKEAAAAAGRKRDNLHAAIASVDVGSGEVLALYGGRDFVKNTRNWATTPRPTGSTFKTFALTAGLRGDYSLRSTFNGNTFTPPGTSTSVRNEFSMQYGSAVTLLKATADSINTAFVDLTTKLPNGPKEIAKAAQDAGAPDGPGWDTGTDRISLGIAEVSPLNMAGAYATYANEGTQVGNHVIKEVRDASDKVIFKADTKGKQAIDADIARDVTYALSDVVEQGTGRTVSTLGRPVAGKTGTAGVGDDVVSAWFVAYTKQISTAVMYVANDDGTGDLDPYARPGDSTFFGGTYPAQTWRDFMAEATAGQEVRQFDPPAWVNADRAPRQAPVPQQTYRQTQAPQPTATRSSQASSAPPSDGGGSSTPAPSREPTRQPTPQPSSDPTTREPTTRPTTTRPTTTRPSSSTRPTGRSSNQAPRDQPTGGDG